MLQTLLFFHLIAAMALFAGIAIEIAAFVSLQRATTASEVRAAMLHVPLVGPLMVSGVVLLLAMGIAMVYMGGYGWQPWLLVALAMTVVLTLGGKLINGARCEAIHALAHQAGDGPLSTDIDARRRDPVLTYTMFASSLELIAMVYVMSSKPLLSGCVAAIAAGLVVAVIPTMLVLRRSPAAQRAEVH